MSEPTRVLIADDMSKKAVEILSGAGFQVDFKIGMKPEELAAVIGQYHGIGIRSASKIKADTLANPGNLKIIGRAGVGVDNIDVKAATEKGILVINTPQGNAAAAAELAIGLMFALARKIPGGHAHVSGGPAKWEKAKPFRQPILTPITAASEFYPAEDYHQDYYKKNPVQYRFYVTGCGRYARLDQLWGPLRKH